MRSYLLKNTDYSKEITIILKINPPKIIPNSQHVILEVSRHKPHEARDNGRWVPHSRPEVHSWPVRPPVPLR